jgi:hypothetical protein
MDDVITPRAVAGSPVGDRRELAKQVRLHLLKMAVLALFLTPVGGAAQVELCEGAERYVREVIGMIAIAEPDTIDDWRTHAMVPGCRVTAAAAARRPVRDAARAFYETILNDGWARTPDPRDAPNEASMRFRKDGADCLFNFYDNSMSLNTDAEMTVTDAVWVRPGEAIYNFLVLCTPAMPAAPRGG